MRSIETALPLAEVRRVFATLLEGSETLPSLLSSTRSPEYPGLYSMVSSVDAFSSASLGPFTVEFCSTQDQDSIVLGFPASPPVTPPAPAAIPAAESPRGTGKVPTSAASSAALSEACSLLGVPEDVQDAHASSQRGSSDKKTACAPTPLRPALSSARTRKRRHEMESADDLEGSPVTSLLPVGSPMVTAKAAAPSSSSHEQRTAPQHSRMKKLRMEQ